MQILRMVDDHQHLFFSMAMTFSRPAAATYILEPAKLDLQETGESRIESFFLTSHISPQSTKTHRKIDNTLDKMMS